VKVAVVAISDRASRGEYADLTGPEIERLVLALYPQAVVSRRLVPDESVEIRAALEACVSDGADIVLTTGGTGLSPRDVTPETTRAFCDREIPGIEETLRAQSLADTPAAMLSRGYAGMRGSCLVVNFPGSMNAVRRCMGVFGPVMEHALRMVRGEGHA
jgi:molybdopterin adenylyltransferase